MRPPPRPWPYVFPFVFACAVLLLLVMFRSIVIPLKAIVLNILAAGRRLARFGERATVAHADAARLPFADDTFDVAFSFLMLHHVGNWEAALRELVRVVRPGGLVLGCDMIHSRFLDLSERAFGSGEEPLMTLDAFGREAAQFGLRGWKSEPGPLHAFRFALAV